MIKRKVLKKKRTNPLYSVPKITTAERNRVKKVIQDWQWHHKDFFDIKYWTKRFAPFIEIFDKYKSIYPGRYFRSERTDINNKYEIRYSSWSHDYNTIKGFGWGERQLVYSDFQSEDVLADLHYLELDTEGSQEIIIKPGIYDIRLFEWGKTSRWL